MKQISSKKFINQTIKEYELKGDDKKVIALIVKRFSEQNLSKDMIEIESIAELIKYLKHRRNAKFN